MITTIITLFILLGVLALVWFGVNRMGVPEPIKTIVLVIIGLIALFYLYNMFVGGGSPGLNLK